VSTEASPNVSDFEHRVEHVLLQRMDRLERENRRLKRYSGMMVVACAVLLGLSAAMVFFSGRFSGLPGAGQVVAARQFVLRDGGKEARGAWGLADDGSVRLTLNDQQGRERVRVSVLQDGSAGISLSDSANRKLAVFGVLPDQNTTLALTDRAGTPRAVLGVSSDGSSNLVFADRTGSTRAGIGVDTRGVGTFSLIDRAGRELGAEPEPPPVEEPAPDDSPQAAAPSPQPAPKRR
jgi:hypothetical protein